MVPTAIDHILLSRPSLSFRHLGLKNLTIISDFITKARMVEQLVERRSTVQFVSSDI